MSGEPRWDQPLDPAGVRGLSPADRSRRAVTSFERKVHLLETWARDGLPQGATVPRSRPALRKWPEGGSLKAALKLWDWSDPNIDRPDGKNWKLYKRFLAAIDALKPKQRTPVKTARELAEQLKMLERRHMELLVQNATLVEEIVRLRKAQASSGGSAV